MRVNADKGLIADVLPIDTRFYVDDTDGNDIIWAAYWIKQTKAQIEREYSKKGDRPVKVTEGEVVDFWDGEHNVVFVDKQIVREQPNPYGYPPFVMVVCPTGSSLASQAAIEHQGESLLWANRGLWNEKNRVATILQTMTIKSLFGPMQYEYPEGTVPTKPKESPYDEMTVHPVPKGGGYKPMPISDIRAATRLFYSVLESSIQRGSLPAIDYGTLTFPLSAVALKRLSGTRDDIFLPRIQAKALFYQALSRMIIKQCIQLDQKLEIGREGSKNSYTRADLEGDYSIKYRFYTVSQEEQLANLAIANAAQGFLSPDTIRRDVLKLKDPEGERIKWESAQAEKLDEVLFLFRRAVSLVDKERPSEQDQIEAKILVKRIKTILRQRAMAGRLSELEGQRTPEPEEKGKELLPLFARARAGVARTPEVAEPEEVERG